MDFAVPAEPLRRGLAACIGTALLLCPTHGSAADVSADFRSELKQLRQTCVELDNTWHTMLRNLPDKGKSLTTVDLALKSLLTGKDLHIRIYCADGKPFRAMGWSPEWNQSEHAVKIDGLDITETEEAGRRLTTSIAVRLLWDGWVPMDSKDWAAWFTITCTIDGTELNGTYSAFTPEEQTSQLPKARGRVTGTLVAYSASTKRPAAIPEPKISGWDPYLAYRNARRRVQYAENRYQDIRAVAMAMTAGLPYRRAHECAVPARPRYDDYDPPSVARAKKIGKGKARVTLDDIEDDMDLGGLDDEPPKKEVSPAAKDPKTPRALAELRDMSKRAATLLALVKAYNKTATRKPFPLSNGDDPGDPLFHPWYKTLTPLAPNKKGTLVLPADAGAKGKQNWAAVSNWRLLGPFPLGEWYGFDDLRAPNKPNTYRDWTSLVPGLPEVVAHAGSAFTCDMFPSSRKGSRRCSAGGRKLTWKPIKPYNDFGGIAPPYLAARNPFYGRCLQPPGYNKDAGMDMAAFLFESEIRAPKDMELWTAIGMQARGMVWINGKLLWAGPADWKRGWLLGGSMRPPENRAEAVALLKVPFKKGENKLRFRLENGFCSSFFWARICTRGAPAEKARAKALFDTIANARKSLKPAVTGYQLRGDQTGVFTDSHPPIAWNLKKRHNIKWYTPLPYWSNGSPVLSKDRVFVPVEPDRLFCLDKETGKILWERRCGAYEILPEPERKKAHQLYDAWWAAVQERAKVPASMMRQPKWIRNSHMYYWEEQKKAAAEKNEREGASPEMIALLDKKAELEANPDPQAVQDELTKLLQQIEKLKAKELKNDPEFIKAQKIDDALRTTNGALIKFMNDRFGVSKLGGYWYDYDGYQFSTPITDGKHVWVKTGFGALACFDMDGKKKYIVRHGGTGSGSATIPSPMLVDGKIIIPLVRRDPGKTRGKGRNHVTVAFDAETGKELWSAPHLKCGWGAGTHVAMRLTNGKDSMAVVVSNGGTVIRTDDGKVLVESIGAMNDAVTMTVADDVLIFTATPPMSAVRLIMVDRDTVSFRPLWRRADSSQYQTAVAADGILFTFRGGSAGVRSVAGERWAALTRTRVTDGYRLNALPLFRKAGNFWSTTTASRDYVYHYGGDNLFSGAGSKQPMTMAVVERGESGDLLALNAVQRSYSGPAMEGNRLYMRGYQGIFCAEYTGATGKAYEARHIAQTLLDQIPADPPADRPVEDTTPSGYGSSKSRPQLDSGFAPGFWYFAGPFPANGKLPLPKEILKRGSWAADGTAKGAGWKLVGLTRKNLPGNNAYRWEVCGENFTLIDRQRRRVVDLARVVKLQPNTVYYLHAELNNSYDGTVLFEQTTPGVKCWFNGVEIAGGDRLRVRKSDSATRSNTLTLEIATGNDVPNELLISPRFWNCSNPKAEAAEWLNFIRKHKPRLQRVIALAPDSTEAGRAAAALKQAH